MKNNWPIFASAVLISASILIAPHLAPPSTESVQSIPIAVSQFRDQVISRIAELSGVDVNVRMAPYRSSDDIYNAALDYKDELGGHHFTRVRFSHNGVGEYTGSIMGSFLGKDEDILLVIDSATK